MNASTGNTGRRMRRGSKATLIACVTAVCSALIAGAALASSDTSAFGPTPVGLLQSRCAALVVSNHIGFIGKKLSATAGPAEPGACGGSATWTWGVSGKGCKADSTHCEFKIGASTGDTWAQLCINGNSGQGPWESCDYYGVPAKGQGVIEGYVKDKDGGAVAGVDVDAYGNGYGRRGAGATTGADGFYAIQVKAGSYTVIPSEGPHGKAKPSYDPDVAHVKVDDGDKATADFKLKAGIELKLEFAHEKVAADGLQVVKGSITTTEFGKPLGNVQVQLDPLEGKSAESIGLTTPRASLCYAGSRVWPTGTLTDPDYYPVNITTDATGHYGFTLTVGTTPGSWRLDAWAYDSTTGKLSSDPSNASDTKSVTFESSGHEPFDSFLTQLNRASKATSALAGAATSASSLVPLLAQNTAAGGPTGGLLGGYAYALVNAPDGQAMLAFPSAQAPSVSRKGDVTSGADLVFDPAEWSADNSSLQLTLQSGALAGLPTVSQFDAGTSVGGWTAHKGSTITPSTDAFQYLGWAYPSSVPGACY